jgi:hypothetical protein
MNPLLAQAIPMAWKVLAAPSSPARRLSP